jgi:pimeloyl-ACP methyl ester carboxylesterase
MTHQTRCRTALRIALAIAVCSTTAQAADSAPSRMSLEALRAKYLQAPGRIANIGGVEVYHKDEGRGPAILMIHGSESTLRTWDFIAPVLVERGYRVIRYDVPPRGLSGPVSDEAAARLTPAAFAAALLDHLGVERASCVGVSSGGTTCMYLASTYPERVPRLILSNAPSDPVENAKLPPSAEFDAAQREARETNVRSLRFWNAFLDYFSGDPRRLDAGIREQYYDFGRRQPEKHETVLTGLVRDHEKATTAMSRVQAPTLLIWGARDVLLPPRAADTLGSYLKNTQVSKVLMPDVGHYPPLESPKRFAHLIVAYLEAATPEEPLPSAKDSR